MKRFLKKLLPIVDLLSVSAARYRTHAQKASDTTGEVCARLEMGPVFLLGTAIPSLNRACSWHCRCSINPHVCAQAVPMVVVPGKLSEQPATVLFCTDLGFWLNIDPSPFIY